jgi:ABC-type multidrug transport system fused ATPase/permease subunit
MVTAERALTFRGYLGVPSGPVIKLDSEGKQRKGFVMTPVLPRLLARFRPERFRLAVVVVFVVLSVGGSIAGTRILGAATDIIFTGFVGRHLPAGATKAQVIAGLRSHGEGRVGGMIAAMNVTPGVGVDIDRLGRVLALAALLYLSSAVLSWAQAYLMAGIAQRTVYRLRQAVEEKLARLPLRYFDSHSHGDIISRVTNDLDNLTTSLQQGLGQLLTSVLLLLGLLGVMFWISPPLAAVSLVTIPLATVVTALVTRRSKIQFIEQWHLTGRLNGLVEETHTGHDLVLAFSQQEALIEEFGRQNEQLLATSFRAQVLSGVIQPTLQFIGNINYVVIAAFGGYQVLTGAISLGGVQALIQYSRQFSNPATEIASQMNMLQSGLASARRVFEFLDAPEEAATPARPGVTLGERSRPVCRVRLEHVSFRYAPDRPLIEDFTLEAAPGQTVAIVGPTGAGKTTIVNLLMRFYEIDSGRILLDGTDYRDLSRDQVRRCFSMVLQDALLFAGTIRDNIAYGKEGATDEEIVAAAKAAYVDHFVRTLPDGYATIVSGDASGVSSGQKQLLTIARAFLANPGILILDEATSNIDSRTETLIQNAMIRLRSGRTSFVIAHRLSTIRNADMIVVMDAGQIVEQGTHEELLRTQGPYYTLYNTQFTGALT